MLIPAGSVGWDTELGSLASPTPSEDTETSNTTHPTLPGLSQCFCFLLCPSPRGFSQVRSCSRCSLPCLSLLVFHFIWPYFHNQLFWGARRGAAVSCHLAVTVRSSKGLGVTLHSHRKPGLREHGWPVLSLIPPTSLPDTASRHWAGKEPDWHLPQKRVENCQVWGQELFLLDYNWQPLL